MTHADLVTAAYRWVLKNTKCRIAFREYKAGTLNKEEPDVIGFGHHGFSVVIECKASRADFLADKAKQFRADPDKGMGLQRYYCCPSGLLNKIEMPRLWGLIYVDDNHRAFVAHDPYETEDGIVRQFVRDQVSEAQIMFSALRRLHLRGRLEEIYEPAPTDAAGSLARAMPYHAATTANAGEVWVKKASVNHPGVSIVEATKESLYIKSLKTGAPEKIPAHKFYRDYRKGGEA
jgi:hypothetical protein